MDTLIKVGFPGAASCARPPGLLGRDRLLLKVSVRQWLCLCLKVCVSSASLGRDKGESPGGAWSEEGCGGK